MGKPVIAAIDPGSSGAIAWYDSEGRTHTENLPELLDNLVALFRKVDEENFGITFYVEQVGTYMPGNSGPAAATFARHCGHIDAILATLGAEVKYVTPQKWMKTMPLTHFPTIPAVTDPKEKAKELARRKSVRKNELKEFAASKFPVIRVTLKNSDALGLLYWAHHYDTQQELL